MNNSSKTALRILGVIGAVIFSILLVVTMIAAPLYSVTMSITKPDTVISIIRGIDYKELLLSDETINSTIEDILTGTTYLPEEIETYIAPLIESPAMDEVIGVYVEDVVDAFRGNETAFSLTPQTLESIVEEHMDAIVTLAQEHAPEGKVIDKATAEETIRKAASTYGGQLIEALPDAAQIHTLAEEIRKDTPISIFIEPTVPYILYGAIVLLAALVFFCRFEKLKGLLWVGIDALIASLPLFAIFALIGDGSSIANAFSAIPSVGTVLESVLAVLSHKTMLGGIILIAVAVLLIAGYITYTVLMNKRADNAIVPAPVTAETETL